MFKIFKQLHATSCLYNLRCSFKPFVADLVIKHPEPMRHLKSFATDLALALSSDIGTEEIIVNLTPSMEHLSTTVKDIAVATIKFAAVAHRKSTVPSEEVMRTYTVLEMDMYRRIYEYMNVDLTFDKHFTK